MIEDALNQLRAQSKVILPPEFTYFHHATNYMPEILGNKKLWADIPADSFTIKGEMSFVERGRRAKAAFDYGSLNNLTTTYGVSKNALNFNIKVIVPKQNLTEEELQAMGKDEQYKVQLRREHYGLGDNRHAKLPGKTKIYIFASGDCDELSGAKVLTVYGVREQDVEYYSKCCYYAECNGNTPAAPDLPKNGNEAMQQSLDRELRFVANNLGLDWLKPHINEGKVKLPRYKQEYIKAIADEDLQEHIYNAELKRAEQSILENNNYNCHEKSKY